MFYRFRRSSDKSFKIIAYTPPSSSLSFTKIHASVPSSAVRSIFQYSDPRPTTTTRRHASMCTGWYFNLMLNPCFYPQNCSISSFYWFFNIVKFIIKVAFSVGFFSRYPQKSCGETDLFFSKRKHTFLTAEFHWGRFCVSISKLRLVVFESFL